jgi:hypothetical protein
VKGLLPQSDKSTAVNNNNNNNNNMYGVISGYAKGACIFKNLGATSKFKL